MSLAYPIKTVLIGIQARSTSERLPNKAFALIGEKRMLDHCIDAAWKAAKYLNRHTDRSGIKCVIAVLTPEGDPIVKEFGRRCDMVEGSEADVLSRYVKAAKKYEADFITRITGDCPLIPPWLISKSIKTTVVNRYDYYSNVDEKVRTAPDGYDCEVMSYRLLDHLDKFADTAADREHVTTYIRRNRPDWARMGFMSGNRDYSESRKISVDTAEDLEAVRREYDAVNDKNTEAYRIYGKQAVHKV